VLVWGSGAVDAEHHAKRIGIRQSIKEVFTNADVHFSEDLELREALPSVGDLSVPEQELWHLAGSDLCVVMDTSKGAGEEIAHFVGSSFAGRLLILTHERYREASSFPATLRKTANQIFYTDAEYLQCSLTSRIITRLQHTALKKLAQFGP
jgi:hypothetical protein